MNSARFIRRVRLGDMNRRALTSGSSVASNRADEVAAADMRALRIPQQVRDRRISASDALPVKGGLPVAQFGQQTIKQRRHFLGQ